MNFVFKTYAENLMEQAKLIRDAVDGRMEISICFFQLYKITGDTLFQEFGEKLLRSECENVSNSISLTYKTGLAGIGVGVVWLLHNDFIEGNADEILEDIDARIQSTSYTRSYIKEPGFLNGVCGLTYYLYCRVKYSATSESLQTLRNKSCLINMVDWLGTYLTEELQHQDLCDIYFLLVRLYKLNLYNYKIEQLINQCLDLYAQNNFTILPSDNYDCLGISLLKVLKPWI